MFHLSRQLKLIFASTMLITLCIAIGFSIQTILTTHSTESNHLYNDQNYQNFSQAQMSTDAYSYEAKLVSGGERLRFLFRNTAGYTITVPNSSNGQSHVDYIFTFCPWSSLENLFGKEFESALTKCNELEEVILPLLDLLYSRIDSFVFSSWYHGDPRVFVYETDTHYCNYSLFTFYCASKKTVEDEIEQHLPILKDIATPFIDPVVQVIINIKYINENYAIVGGTASTALLEKDNGVWKILYKTSGGEFPCDLFETYPFFKTEIGSSCYHIYDTYPAHSTSYTEYYSKIDYTF